MGVALGTPGVDAPAPMSERPAKAPKKSPVERWTPESGRRPHVGEIDEVLVDAPTKQALLMLGVIAAATLVMWAAGRAACNYHVPGDGLTPRPTTLEERTRNPKAVGIELAQALSGADFDTASKLVLPSAASLVEQARACGSCDKEKAARSKILSVGEILQAARDEAVVAVRTVGGVGGEVERVFRVQRNTEKREPWRVVGQLPGRENLPALEGQLTPESTPRSPHVGLPLRRTPADAPPPGIAAPSPSPSQTPSASPPPTSSSPSSSSPPAAP